MRISAWPASTPAFQAVSREPRARDTAARRSPAASDIGIPMRDYMAAPGGPRRTAGRLPRGRSEARARRGHRRAREKLGKPMLFHKVKGTRLPVLTNIYATRERIAEVLGIGDGVLPQVERARTDRQVGRQSRCARADGAGRSTVDCKLSDLPLITYSERDGAPYFTSAMFSRKEPETGVRQPVVPPLDVRQRPGAPVPAGAAAPPDAVSRKGGEDGQVPRGRDADRAAADLVPHRGRADSVRRGRARGGGAARRQADSASPLQAHRPDGARPPPRS